MWPVLQVDEQDLGTMLTTVREGLRMGAGLADGQAGPAYHPNHSEGRRWTGPGV